MPNSINHAIRQTCLGIRSQLLPTFQRTHSTKICNHIRALNQYRYAKHIALYHAINGEVDLGNLWRSAPLHGKYCYFPVMNDDLTVSFLPATPASDFYLNHYGILEPNTPPHHAISPDKLDIIFAPLVAFDEYGTRVGLGKGFYDRTLANIRPKLLMGVGYEFQKQPFLEPKSWDVRLDAITTDKKTYWSK
jgi:5-formyltetrahydrofolate cyclo-ligase